MLNFYSELLFYGLAPVALAFYRFLSPKLSSGWRGGLLALISLPFLLLLKGGAEFVLPQTLCVALLWVGISRVRAGGAAWPWVTGLVLLQLLAKHPASLAWLPFLDLKALGLAGWGWMGFSYFVFRAIDALLAAKRRDFAAGAGQTAALGLYFVPYVSGPINRIGSLARDLAAPDAPLTFLRVRAALIRACLGIVKMLFLAKWAYFLSVASPDFRDGRLPGLPGLVVGAWAYYLYIYFDFSGYTDVAIALSGLFGVNLPENFNKPFLSANIQEFWNRWHMTLSGWFRDHLFFPALKTLRARLPRLHPQAAQAGALFFTFFTMGAWHGDGLNWMAYGLFHGLSMTLWALKRWLEDSLAPVFFGTLRENRIYRLACMVFTFNYVSFGLLLMLDFKTLRELLAG